MELVLNISLTGIGFSLGLLSGMIILYSSLTLLGHVIFVPLLLGSIGLFVSGALNCADNIINETPNITVYFKNLNLTKKIA